MSEDRKPLILEGNRTVSIKVPAQDSNETVLLQDSNETVLLQDSNETVLLQDSNETVLLQGDDGTQQLDESGNAQVNYRELYQMPEGAMLANRYVIGDILGFGGFGITYSAWDSKLEMRVAIKEYYPSSLVNRISGSNRVEIFSEKKRDEYEKGLTRFLGEAQNMAKFSGKKNIVSVYNYFKENGTAYLVMEYLDGVSLKEYTQKHGEKLPYAQVIEITQSVINALKILHKNHIIHRDISPDNIFMCKDGTVKLIDFGAARFANETDEAKTLSVILKPGFAPPEQYRSKGKQGPWTDIYALGATMYRIVTGVVPEESVNRNVQDTLKEPKEYVPEIPKYFNNILMKTLALQPQLRFQNVEDLERKLLRKKSVSSVKGELFRRKFMRVALVLLIVGGIAWLGQKEYEYIQEERNKATLEECSISVWIPVDDGEDMDAAKATFEQAISDFTTTYPMVTVDIETVPAGEYNSKIQVAAGNNTLPTVLETNDLPDVYNQYLADLSYTSEMLDASKYVFKDAIKSSGNEIKKLPTAFSVPIMYSNTQITAKDDTENDLESFLDEKAQTYIGTFEDYQQIQNKMAGVYEMALPDVKPLPVEFSHAWSVSNSAATAQQNAGIRLVYYLMGEQAQDILYVQGDDGFPIYKDLLEVYISIYPEMEMLNEIDKKDQEYKMLTQTVMNELLQAVK